MYAVRATRAWPSRNKGASVSACSFCFISVADDACTSICPTDFRTCLSGRSCTRLATWTLAVAARGAISQVSVSNSVCSPERRLRMERRETRTPSPGAFSRRSCAEWSMPRGSSTSSNDVLAPGTPYSHLPISTSLASPLVPVKVMKMVATGARSVTHTAEHETNTEYRPLVTMRPPVPDPGSMVGAWSLVTSSTPPTSPLADTAVAAWSGVA
mmetsp:Transcript_54118/g.127820  ORF Transcript_54118/g.127820 Transcript_54118/m.127820 type:complete len:213 (-) Transcript_54118:1241-1879(-)